MTERKSFTNALLLSRALPITKNCGKILVIGSQLFSSSRLLYRCRTLPFDDLSLSPNVEGVNLAHTGWTYVLVSMTPRVLTLFPKLINVQSSSFHKVILDTYLVMLIPNFMSKGISLLGMFVFDYVFLERIGNVAL
jgi:hypothetical protein